MKKSELKEYLKNEVLRMSEATSKEVDTQKELNKELEITKKLTSTMEGKIKKSEFKEYLKTEILHEYKLNWISEGYFRYLGIDFSVHLSQMVEHNYCEKIKEIKSQMTLWLKRSMTPLGRVTIVKSLFVPKLNRIQYGKNTFSYYGSHLWNILHNESKINVDLVSFKKLLHSATVKFATTTRFATRNKVQNNIY